MTTLRLTLNLNKDVERLLEELKEDYPALDYPELFKLALSDYHRRHKEQRRSEDSQRWNVWEASLPVLELSEEEKISLTKARGEKGRVMSVEEIMAEATSD